MPTLSLWDGLRAVRLKLWDEERGRLVTFAEARAPPMADRDDVEFTYSLIDRIFRLSLGELADFSGAKYDGDFSLSLEEAQRRKHEYVAEQIGIGPGRRVLDLGCGWGPLLDFVRAPGRAPGSASPCPRRRRLPAGATGSTSTSRTRGWSRASASARFDAVASLGAFEHFCSPEELPRPGGRTTSTATCSPGSRACCPTAAGSISRRWSFGRNMIPLEEIDITAPRDSDAWYLALMGRQFPGSLLPFGEEQIVRAADPHFRLRVERERPARLHRDDPPMARAVRRPSVRRRCSSCGCSRAG